MIDFDPYQLAEFLRDIDLATGSGLASLFSFFGQVQQWRTACREQGQAYDLDAYLEWLRREDHKQLENLILDNRGAFQTLFERMESKIVAAIEDLNASQLARHKELMNLGVDAAKLILAYRNFTATAYQNTPSWQEAQIAGSVTLVNRNRTRLTVRSGSVWIKHERGEYAAILSGGANTTAEGEGGSMILNFKTRRPVPWKQGEYYEPVRLEIQVDQSPDNPLTFLWSDGRFVPTHA